MIAYSRLFLFCLAIATGIVWARPGYAVRVFTYDGAGLDAQAQETTAEPGGEVAYGFNGAGVSINSRYNGWNNGLPPGVPEDQGGDVDDDNRNEFWVMRFDLSGMEKSQIGNVELSVTMFRNADNNKDLRIWGVNSGVDGLNTFSESSITFGDVPGLTEDGEIQNQGVDQSLTTYLGDFQIPEREAGSGLYPQEGDLVHFDQTVIDESGPNEDSEHGDGGIAVQNTLQGFLRSLSTDDMAVFLIGGYQSNGQIRIATKEATATDTGLYNCTEFNDCAPYLDFEFVEGVPGDYNGNGIVDAADYTFWRDRLGQMITLPNSDSTDIDGVVTTAEYDFWKSQFGNSGAGAGAAALAVPEPSALILVGMISIMGAAVATRRR
jgi:hypothetical protein